MVWYDPNTLRPITPNHLIMMKSKVPSAFMRLKGRKESIILLNRSWVTGKTAATCWIYWQGRNGIHLSATCKSMTFSLWRTRTSQEIFGNMDEWLRSFKVVMDWCITLNYKWMSENLIIARTLPLNPQLLRDQFKKVRFAKLGRSLMTPHTHH